MDVDVALGAWVLIAHTASIARRVHDGGAMGVPARRRPRHPPAAMRVIVAGECRLRAPYADDVEHYRKLLSRYTELELAAVRDARAVARRLPERAYVAMLDAGGGSLDSVAFSRFLAERRMEGRDLAFVLGGPFGAPELPRLDRRLSLGPMTLPHQLAWVVLLEQIYRAHKILAGEPYHH